MKSFFTLRWHGRIGWQTLFWRDLLKIGTAFNVLMSGLAVVLLVNGAPAHWALLAHLLPLPYNLFIVRAIASASERPGWVVGASLLWLAVFVMV